METSYAFSMPPGFGFHPTDVELISHYLKRKILGCQIDLEVIPEVDIYKYEPWDLPAKSLIPTRDSKWHFFTSRDKKYPNGSRSNRATAAGYWKSTGKDRNIRLNNRIIGTKKTLVFHQGRPPYGKRTEWIMHEYYLNEKEYSAAPIKDIFVLCRVTKRKGSNQEEEELVLPPVKKCINPCLSLPKKNCSKELEDIFVHLIPKKEASSPTEEVDDYESWLAELYDPNISTTLLLSEPANEQKVDGDSLALMNDLDKKCSHGVDETNVSPPEDHGSHNFHGYNSDPHELDCDLFLLGGESGPAVFDAVCDYQNGSELGVGYNPYLDYEDKWAEDSLVRELLSPSSVFLNGHGGMIAEDYAESVVSFAGGNQDTGIQIRERQNPPREVLSQRIRFQVHNSTKSGPVDQTFVFVSEDGRLEPTSELVIKDSTAPRTKVIRGQAQEKPTSEKAPPVLFPPRGPSPSPLWRWKLTKSGRRAKLLHKSRDCLRKARGFVRNIGSSLRRSSLVGLNCLIVVARMLGAALLVAFFLVREALRFLCPTCL